MFLSSCRNRKLLLTKHTSICHWKGPTMQCTVSKQATPDRTNFHPSNEFAIDYCSVEMESNRKRKNRDSFEHTTDGACDEINLMNKFAVCVCVFPPPVFLVVPTDIDISFYSSSYLFRSSGNVLRACSQALSCQPYYTLDEYTAPPHSLPAHINHPTTELLWLVTSGRSGSVGV